jgi:serine/threonine-protein kinase
VLKIAGALGAAHAARIVHRDLKPENVFLVGRPDTAADDVRVVDFGAAMVLGKSRVTKTGIVFGTPHYMSPEQASGQPVDHRADIYALGVIMYEMFTGKVPFEADTFMGVLTQHMFVQPIPPSQVSANARELGALEDVLLRALEKKPEQRYGTMEQLIDAIQSVVRFAADGSMMVAPSRSKPPPPPPKGLANELELPTAEEISSTLMTSSDARRRRRRAQRWVLYGGIVLGVAMVCVVAMQALRKRVASEEPPAASTLVAAPSPPAAASASAIPPPPEVPATAEASDAAPPTTAASAAGRPTRPRGAPPPAAAKKAGSPTPAGAGEFTDPWAKRP